MNELDDLRAEIEEEINDPTSHGPAVIRLVLSEIEEKFGQEEVDNAIHDFQLPACRKAEPISAVTGD
jgi:hypothetical protein